MQTFCIIVYLILLTSMFWLADVQKLNSEFPLPCTLTVSAFCLFFDNYCSEQMVVLALQPAIPPGTVCVEDSYNMDNNTIIMI